jgi:hypothetical protein
MLARVVMVLPDQLQIALSTGAATATFSSLTSLVNPSRVGSDADVYLLACE